MHPDYKHSIGRRGFWDEKQRIAKLQEKKPVMTRLAETIHRETFHPIIDKGYSQEPKSNAGRKRIDPLILFKMLVLHHLFNLSDEEIEFQVNNHRSFEEFGGLGAMNDIPDTTTMAFFRERLRKAGVIEEPFEMFERCLSDQGLEAIGGQIIEATLAPIPKQHNSREENKDKKSDRLPDGWKENPNRLQQKYLDARWAKKNGINKYSHNNSICIDPELSFIRRFVMTPADIHDNQMLQIPLDPVNQVDYV